MRPIEQLTTEVLALPSASRSLLAGKLVESLELDADGTLQATWVTEAKSRIDEVRNGAVMPIPGWRSVGSSKTNVDSAIS
jgi:hypothetical protein